MGYEYCHSGELHRERDEVLIVDDLYVYLMRRYSGLSDFEIAKVEARVRAIENTPYETNRSFLCLLTDGFDLRRDDCRKSGLAEAFGG